MEDSGVMREGWATAPRPFGPKKMRYGYQAVLEMIVSDPTITQGEIAEALGYTQAWVSLIINSDAFQQELRVRNDQIFNDVIIPLRRKVEAVAHRAVEKVAEALDGDEVGPDYSLNVADKFLHKLGYGPQKGPAMVVAQEGPTQNNFFSVDAETLAAARAALLKQNDGKILSFDTHNSVQSGGCGEQRALDGKGAGLLSYSEEEEGEEGGGA